MKSEVTEEIKRTLGNLEACSDVEMGDGDFARSEARRLLDLMGFPDATVEWRCTTCGCGRGRHDSECDLNPTPGQWYWPPILPSV